MILSAINNLKRAISLLDDMPAHINLEKKKVMCSLNDLFEDLHDKFDDEKDKDTLKKLTIFRGDVMSTIETFCNLISSDLKKDITIVEE